jgi:hypothetical protein
MPYAAPLSGQRSRVCKDGVSARHRQRNRMRPPRRYPNIRRNRGIPARIGRLLPPGSVARRPVRRRAGAMRPQTLRRSPRGCFVSTKRGGSRHREAIADQLAVQVRPGRIALAKTTTEGVLPDDPAIDSPTGHQACQCRRRRAAAVEHGARGSPARLAARRRGHAIQPYDALTKADGFAVHDPDSAGLGTPMAVGRRRAEQVGWERNAEHRGRGDRGGQQQSRTAEAGAGPAALEDAASLKHARIVKRTGRWVQPPEARKSETVTWRWPG